MNTQINSNLILSPAIFGTNHDKLSDGRQIETARQQVRDAVFPKLRHISITHPKVRTFPGILKTFMAGRAYLVTAPSVSVPANKTVPRSPPR